LPSFSYFATLDDSFVILHDLCDRGLRIVPDSGPVDEPKAPAFERVTDELKMILGSAPKFYLAGAFTRFPVQFRRFTTGPEAGKYGVDLMAQGPLMPSLVGRVSSVDGTSTLLPGGISYHNEYRNPETDRQEPASKALIAAYTLAMMTIRNRCTRYADGIFVAPGALRLVQRRLAVLADR
jgi:hypothetical protein